MTKTATTLSALALALSILAAPTGALAQLPDPPPDPSERDVAEARDVFLLGMERARAEEAARQPHPGE